MKRFDGLVDVGSTDRVVVESPAETAIDPVCGMTVTVADARWVTEHDGQTFYFCAPGCQGAFESDPARFHSVSS